MKLLNSIEQQKVEDLVDKAYSLYESNEKEKSFEFLKEAYLIFPNPKEFSEAYNIAKYSFEDYIKEKKYDKAKIWLNRMIENNNNLHHSDEDCSFAIAKYKFEIGEYEDSLIRFKEVFEIAGGRYFEDEDPKYKDFYLNPEKYIKE